jgi:hypothetical protein
MSNQTKHKKKKNDCESHKKRQLGLITGLSFFVATQTLLRAEAVAGDWKHTSINNVATTQGLIP